jgi:hypothetical protein
MNLNILRNVPWKVEPYSKQNWGNNFHSISSYVGRIKPSFAHFLIKEMTKEGDVVYDPFCGVGTVPLESSLMGRISIGNDLNPYAVLISKSKIDIRGLDSEIEFLDKIKISDSKLVDISSVPLWVKEYYHLDTLKEIIFLRDIFIQESRYFLLGCLLGISHGHRPQHLSIRTGYIIPYIPNPKPPIEYRYSIEKLKEKVKRMYKDNPEFKFNPIIYSGDSRNTNQILDKSIDCIISSPPYYDTLDYVSSNKLRLFFSGVDDVSQVRLKSELIQNKNSYIEEMVKIGVELKRILKDSGKIVFVLGDVHYGKKSKNTAKDISEIYHQLGLFKTIEIIDDIIPASKTTIVKYGGENAISQKKEKLDRVLILEKQ